MTFDIGVHISFQGLTLIWTSILAFSTSYCNEYSSAISHILLFDLAENRSNDDTQHFPNSLLSRELPLLFVSVYWKPSPVMIRDTKGKSFHYRSEISLRKAPLGAFLSTMSFRSTTTILTLIKYQAEDVSP